MLKAQQADPAGIVTDKHIRYTHVELCSVQQAQDLYTCGLTCTTSSMSGQLQDPQASLVNGLHRPERETSLDSTALRGTHVHSRLMHDFCSSPYRDQLMTFMFAGSDTTASTLAFCLFEIAKRPKVQARLQQEIRQLLKDTPLGEIAVVGISEGPL